jgi:pimeloyl-ACP methyl ester carboxylesterase
MCNISCKEYEETEMQKSAFFAHKRLHFFLPMLPLFARDQGFHHFLSKISMEIPMSTVHTNSTRRHFLKYLGVGAASAAVGVSGTFVFDHRPQTVQAATIQGQTDRSFTANGKGINALLVHGALADTSTWSRITPSLQQQNYRVLAVQLPLTSLEEDIAITRQALATLSGPTIVVAHSYGGSVITGAVATASNVIGLVYIAAFAPMEGENINALFGQYPATPLLHHVVPSYRTGYVWCDPSWFPQVFAQDLDLAVTKELAIGQKPIQPGCFATPSGSPAWKTHPSWYLVSTNDHCIDPDSERFMAKRMGATTREVASSHLSPLSHPHEVLALIADATSKGKPLS